MDLNYIKLYGEGFCSFRCQIKSGYKFKRKIIFIFFYKQHIDNSTIRKIFFLLLYYINIKILSKHKFIQISATLHVYMLINYNIKLIFKYSPELLYMHIKPQWKSKPWNIVYINYYSPQRAKNEHHTWLPIDFSKLAHLSIRRQISVQKMELWENIQENI